jgi:hypothetical protein
MSEIDDGGAAFPIDSYMLNPNATEKEIKKAQSMTLRDYFAAAALTGFLANSNNELIRFHEIASDAYNTADAMLAARKEGA